MSTMRASTKPSRSNTARAPTTSAARVRWARGLGFAAVAIDGHGTRAQGAVGPVDHSGRLAPSPSRFPARMTNLLKRAQRYSDLVAALVVVLVVVMMVVPLPPMLLDLMITANISAALAVVIATLYLPRALDFSSFPSLLLLTTLFRLAINVSVTRLILLHGDAGSVVTSFGHFVVGGNVVVGLVIFFILVVIQFVVL